jgi:hypothetical protein
MIGHHFSISASQRRMGQDPRGLPGLDAAPAWRQRAVPIEHPQDAGFLAPDVAMMHTRFHIYGDVDESERTSIGIRVVRKRPETSLLAPYYQIPSELGGVMARKATRREWTAGRYSGLKEPC